MAKRTLELRFSSLNIAEKGDEKTQFQIHVFSVLLAMKACM